MRFPSRALHRASPDAAACCERPSYARCSSNARTRRLLDVTLVSPSRVRIERHASRVMFD